MKKSYLLLLALLALSSCKDEQEETVSSRPEKMQECFNIKALYSTNHTISRKQAEKLALEFANGTDKNGNSLKSLKTLTVSNSVVRLGGDGLKSTKGGEDTLGYIVNFADNKGYAYVCADDRVISNVMAMFDEGNYNGLDEADTLMTPIYNVIDRYVSSSINEFEAKKEQRKFIVEQAIKNGDLNTNVNRKRLKSSYTFVCDCKPLLKGKLSQGSIEQADLPTCTECMGVCKGQKVKPGCLTIALAQLYSFWEYEWINTYTGYKITSHDVTYEFEPIDYYDSPSFKERLKKLERAKSEAVSYFYNKIKDNGGIMSSTHYATSMNFGCVAKVLGSNYMINEMPFDSYEMCDWIAEYEAPLIIRGEGLNVPAHFWLADAYIGKYVLNVSVINGKTVQNEDKLYCYLHYNWGWGGTGNGYFLDDLFVNTFNGGLYDTGSFVSSLKERYRITNVWAVYHRNWPKKKPQNSNGFQTF